MKMGLSTVILFAVLLSVPVKLEVYQRDTRDLDNQPLFGEKISYKQSPLKITTNNGSV